MRHQHGHRHRIENAAGDAADDELAQARMPVPAHHHEVRAAVGGVGQDDVLERKIALGDAFDTNRDAVPREMLAHPDTRNLGVLSLHGDDH